MRETLIQIYNVLAQIETKGDSTIKMGMCLNTIAQMVENLPQESAPEIETAPLEKADE